MILSPPCRYYHVFYHLVYPLPYLCLWSGLICYCTTTFCYLLPSITIDTYDLCLNTYTEVDPWVGQRHEGVRSVFYCLFLLYLGYDELMWVHHGAHLSRISIYVKQFSILLTCFTKWNYHVFKTGTYKHICDISSIKWCLKNVVERYDWVFVWLVFKAILYFYVIHVKNNKDVPFLDE